MSDQLFIPDDLFMPWQKPTVRTTDPETSHEAAKTLSGKAGTMRRALLQAFLYDSLTAEEAAEICGYTPADGPWKRVSDLKDARLIVETGETRKASTGRRQRVLCITPLGQEALG